MRFVDADLGIAKGRYFNSIYPLINNSIINFGVNVPSRNGNTRELLDFKTIVDEPQKRCVGGFNRDINIFFLLAEAMWIWAGRKDVSFLAKFNSRMSEFSDDNEVFHAPYGFRLRNWGVSSFDKSKSEEQIRSLEGLDQIEAAISMLKKDPSTRRIALSIWNPDLDLNVDSKDLPCNDMVFLLNRGGKLSITVANRSNDLHWGLPTNMFQFSWILENIALLCDLKVGTETHNSKSLHVYLDNEIHKNMWNSKVKEDLYDYCNPMSIDFEFRDGENRLLELDRLVNRILFSLEFNNETDIDLQSSLKRSNFYNLVWQILKIYLKYKETTPTDQSRSFAIGNLLNLLAIYGHLDLLYLSLGWFLRRLRNVEDAKKIIENNKLPQVILYL